ncbi:helix-turn-helix domain-containing protein [Acetobacter sacchari]|uniref:Helix-turn-helix domain-containing protein n=1 Tax=Acetobacter sacchari TaxID=2661687 RepID=A0ABS3LUA2_9PROT|nr:helix-turn-helix domain-containing protein [Acetobacter sacchari]MBO1359478.1 helix-turn-helix domain-containing protein [Acetobacter sacchari]
MVRYEHPPISAVSARDVFQALSDPIRLEIARRLARRGAQNCSELSDARPRSTMSHHFKVLRDAGVVRTLVQGTEHINSLRSEELESRFPGIVAMILDDDDERSEADAAAFAR